MVIRSRPASPRKSAGCSRKQWARTEPEAGSQKPEARSQKPRTQKSEVRSQNGIPYSGFWLLGFWLLFLDFTEYVAYLRLRFKIKEKTMARPLFRWGNVVLLLSLLLVAGSVAAQQAAKT